MNKKFKCLCCSTDKNVVVVVPIKKDGYLKCPYCLGIELENVN
jgi:DNA-directed RNA polymerase subunit RPC12/RpoP